MFARIKKSGKKYQYLQIVENRKVKGKVKQRVIATIGRIDQMQAKGRVETLIRSLSRFSEQAMLILTGKSDVSAEAVKIGPTLIFERLWKETGIRKAIKRLLANRRFEFDVERAIFLTVLHRLMVSGSDRFCEKWRRDYRIEGTESLELHHLYRAMAFLGEVSKDQEDATSFASRCNKDLIEELEANDIAYILGTRMRRVNAIKNDVLSVGGRYREVHPEGVTSKDPSPLKVKQVVLNDKRYIVCMNPRQARKDAADRKAIIESLKLQLKKGPKSLVGNKGYRRYLSIDKHSARIDTDKVKSESRFDGKWVLTTNTNLSAEKVALKYKELWQVERVFRDVKSMLETRPVYHQRDENIIGHVFCSFLALMLRKELEKRLNNAGHLFEWSDIKQDLKALNQVTIEEGGKRFIIRSECKGHCGKIFQAVKVALPPTIREVV